jgi:phage gpG-like protein
MRTLIRNDIARHSTRFKSRKFALVHSAARVALHIFKVENFDKERMMGGDSWPDRKPGYYANKRAGSRLLVKSGRLRGSIRIQYVDDNKAVIGTEVIYAKRHNEGLNGTPKRQYIGDNDYVNRKINRDIVKSLNKVFR